MRYQDWDILLYPKGCDVPSREFKTTCYAIQENAGGGASSGNVTTPLLTCFVPAVPAGNSFSISLHSWTTPVHIGSLAMSGLGDRAMWQIKVTVDGITVAQVLLFERNEDISSLTVCRTQLCPHDCSWPQAISSGTNIDQSGNQTIRDLGWPSFHKAAIMQRNWDAADPAGRIRVELAAGFKEQLGGKMVFTTLSTIVCFAFFPAPMAHLERVGIAWPNPKMFETPLNTDSYLARNGSGVTQGLSTVGHRPTYSNDSTTASSPIRGLPMPPPPTPAMGYDFHAMQAGNMQAFHDAASNGPTLSQTISGHELQSAFDSMALPSAHDPSRGMKSQLEIRLPSDQLQKLILAMSPSKHAEMQSTDTSQMTPPPLPLHALAAKNGGNDMNKGANATLVAQSSTGMQAASRGSSDISMHNSCTYFPSCTFEDDSSLVVHGNPVCPSTDVKGRKEGSSPLRCMLPSLSSRPHTHANSSAARDSLSTILGSQDNGTVSPGTGETKSSMSSDSPEETPGRKRTRAALKALNINDGSPEKKDPSARKPLRKVSRASSGGSKKARDVATTRTLVKAGAIDDEDKENQMVVDN